ncbi:MAG: YggS family pyridoxal phosphate-dependent enzyme [Ruminococcus sp.]|nr:YggS family pyridoxal phosphate-dependent enzyme [Ruminococcus sp.]MCD7773443.1 YggS family pyridoxal phosphate-dependent enzyme [Ruminococcus sp.]
MVNQGNFDFVVENYNEICYNIQNARAKYTNEQSDVKILAVTKTVAPEIVNAAIDCGITLLGENRVQEYLSKKDFYKPCDVHFIGHLQTNKVKYIINSVSMIQSVDSMKLAREIDRLAKKNNKVMDVLIEVNIGDELSKSGVSKNEAFSLIEQASELENIKIQGLMAIPPINSSDEIYASLYEMFNSLKEKSIPNVDMKILSVGMSGDYEKAIKYGSNLVRIGTKLFGARKYVEV